MNEPQKPGNYGLSLTRNAMIIITIVITITANTISEASAAMAPAPRPITLIVVGLGYFRRGFVETTIPMQILFAMMKS